MVLGRTTCFLAYLAFGTVLFKSCQNRANHSLPAILIYTKHFVSRFACLQTPLSRTSVGSQDLSADPPTRAAPQPDDRLGNLLRLADAAHGTESRNRLQHLLRLDLVKEIRPGGAECDGVDTDAPGLCS